MPLLPPEGPLLRARVLVLVLAIAVASAGSSAAQEAPTLHLSVDVRSDGGASLFPWGEGFALDTTVLVPALRATLDCALDDATSLDHGVDCPDTVTRRDHRLAGELRWTAWQSVLEETGAERLSVWLHLPDAPGLETRTDGGATVVHDRWSRRFHWDREALGSATLSFSVGPDRFWWWRYGIAVGAALATLALFGAGIRARARVLAREDRARAWFGAMLLLQATGVVLFVLGLAVPSLTRFPGSLEMARPSLDRAEAIGLTAALHCALAFLCLVALWVPARHVFREVRGIDPGPAGRTVTLCAFVSLALFVPVGAGATAILTLPFDGTAAAAAAAVAVVSLFVGCGLLAHSLGFTPRIVTDGDLADDVHELAAGAGIPVRRIQLLSGETSRTAWASAGNGSLLFSTYFVRNVPREEFRAVVAHELAHNESRDGLRLGGFLVLSAVVGAVGGVLAAFVLGQWERPDARTYWIAFVVALALALPLAMAVFRRREFHADARGAEICGSPLALARALVRLSNLNDLPLRWPRWLELVLTHPTTESRIHALVGADGVDRVLDLPPVDDAVEVPEPPATESSEDPESSGAPARGAALVSVLALLTTLTLPFAILDLASDRLGLAGGALIGLVAAGAGITAFLTWLLGWIGGRSIQARDLRDVAKRLQDAGVDPAGEGGWIPVAVSPGRGLRVFGGSFVFDSGLLRIEQDRVRFVGAKCGFVTPRAPVEVDLGPSAPGYLPRRPVRFSSLDVDALIWPVESTPWPRPGRSRALARELLESPGAAPADLGPTTSDPPWPDPGLADPFPSGAQAGGAILMTLFLGALAVLGGFVGGLGARGALTGAAMVAGATALAYAPFIVRALRTEPVSNETTRSEVTGTESDPRS